MSNSPSPLLLGAVLLLVTGAGAAGCPKHLPTPTPVVEQLPAGRRAPTMAPGPPLEAPKPVVVVMPPPPPPPAPEEGGIVILIHDTDAVDSDPGVLDTDAPPPLPPDTDLPVETDPPEETDTVDSDTDDVSDTDTDTGGVDTDTDTDRDSDSDSGLDSDTGETDAAVEDPAAP